MELVHNFTVPADFDTAWSVFNDLDTLAACAPGASLTENGGDWADGNVKVKLGAVTFEFSGRAEFVERDRDAGRLVGKGEGRDKTGRSSADAQVEALLTAANGAGESATAIEVRTTLRTTGRSAQFGEKMVESVSNTLLKQFVSALEDVLSQRQAAVSQASPVAAASQATSAETGVGAGETSAPKQATTPGVASDEVLDLGKFGISYVRDNAAVPASIAGSIVATLLAVFLIRRWRQRSYKVRRHIVYLVDDTSRAADSQGTPIN